MPAPSFLVVKNGKNILSLIFNSSIIRYGDVKRLFLLK
jgi:hypothetical protein